MYERFYQLRERPFALSPDPDYLYPSRVHRAALDYLRYGIDGHAGFVVITGEIGSGKTTLLQTLLRHLDDRITVARLVNTNLDPRELLEAIMVDLGAETVAASKPMLVRDLARVLLQHRARDRRVILVVDEAQNLSRAALEEVRMLSNLETEKSKLIQIVLVGQPELRDTLASPELEQLRQRITVSYHIQPLDAAETGAYVNHRLRRAALGVPLHFTRDVTDLVHARSRGIPRLINVICDAALFFGYAEERRIIDTALLEAVFEELEATHVLRSLDPAAPAHTRPVPPGTVARPGETAARPAAPGPRTAQAHEAGSREGLRQPTARPGLQASEPRSPTEGRQPAPVRQERRPLPPAARPPARPEHSPRAGADGRPAGRPPAASPSRMLWSSARDWEPPEVISMWQRFRRLIRGEA